MLPQGSAPEERLKTTAVTEKLPMPALKRLRSSLFAGKEFTHKTTISIPTVFYIKERCLLKNHILDNTSCNNPFIQKDKLIYRIKFGKIVIQSRIFTP